MGWLIDTNVWIAVERRIISVDEVEAITRQESVYVSPVNIAELIEGTSIFAAADTRQRALTLLRRLRRKPQLRITAKTGEIFGQLSVHLRRSGRGADFRINDLWLAAQAVQRNLSLLTANARDFKDIPKLKLAVLRFPEPLAK